MQITVIIKTEQCIRERNASARAERLARCKAVAARHIAAMARDASCVVRATATGFIVAFAITHA